VTTALGPDDLYRRCDPRALPFDSTAEIREVAELVGQARAVEAVTFAIGARWEGYNVFALGPPGVGKQTMVRQLLERQATRQSAPPDWCYVNNPAAPHQPRALCVPAGVGVRLKAAMARARTELQGALPAALDSQEHRNRKQQLVTELDRRHEAALADLARRARDRHVAVTTTDDGIVVSPLGGDELPAAVQAERSVALEQVGAELTVLLQQFHDWTRQHREAIGAVDREVAAAVTHRVIDVMRGALSDVAAVTPYLAELEADIVDHVDLFLDDEDEDDVDDDDDDGGARALRRLLPLDEDDGRLRRYEVNVVVDHAAAQGAPIVYEANPTCANLTGRIEHVARFGALVPDFTLIRPGALHRANGGYLLLEAHKVLQQPLAWEALKRALQTRQVRIESAEQLMGLPSTVSLEPEPIPLEGLKVVLLGDRPLYYQLAALDPDVAAMFKVMADFEETMDRRPDADAEFARLVAGIVQKEGLRPFDRGAVARVIEHAARLAGDARKLSLHLGSIADLLRESDYWAQAAARTVATAADVQTAIDAQLRRAGRGREQRLEAILRDGVLIDTAGAHVGQINGLAVVELGAGAFGHPIRLTARVRGGDGEVVDIEREVELGGPIHSKGVLILTGLIGARYAPRIPLSLRATIAFEQSYGGVEGDSASLAELGALLSALADLPVTQALAVTGSVDQHGNVQAVGGVNEKIEGFFDVCRERGLTGSQGVVIPRANVPHLMLRKDVVAAVAERRFQIHAVRHVDEAMTLLCGRAAGARGPDGAFPDGSVNARVEERLTRFAEDARAFSARSG